jgi:hypothetical protein
MHLLHFSSSMLPMPSHTHKPNVCVTGPRTRSDRAVEFHLKCRHPPQPPPISCPSLLPLPSLPPPPLPIPAGATGHRHRRSQVPAAEMTGAGRPGAGDAAGPGAANGLAWVGNKKPVAYPIDVQDMHGQGRSRCTQRRAGTAENRFGISSRINQDKKG